MIEDRKLDRGQVGVRHASSAREEGASPSGRELPGQRLTPPGTEGAYHFVCDDAWRGWRHAVRRFPIPGEREIPSKRTQKEAQSREGEP